MIFNSLPSLCIRVQSKQTALMCINLMLFHPLTSLICFSKAQKGHLRKNSLCDFVYVPHLSHLSHLLALAFIYSHTTTQTDIDTSITAADWFAFYSQIFMSMLVSQESHILLHNDLALCVYNFDRNTGLFASNAYIDILSA